MDHVSVTSEPRRRASHDAQHSQPCILIVDDIVGNLVATEAILRRDDVAVVTARSAHEAMEVLLDRTVSVAIIDVQMPVMDGIELAENMRGVERTRHVPIIFVTASTLENARVFQAYGTGAIDFLIKPLNEEVLRSKVDALLALDRGRRQLARALEDAEIARRETECLFRLSELTAKCDRPDDLYDPALRAVCVLLGAERASIRLFDERGAQRFVAWRGLSDGYRTTVEAFPVWPRSALAPEARCVADVMLFEEAAPYRELLARERIAAFASIPLVRDVLLGHFTVYWDRPRPFSQHERDLAMTVASQIAQALERARLRDAERLTRERLTRLQCVTAALNAVTTMQDIGDVCVPAIREVVGADVAELYVLDPAGTALEAVRDVGLGSDPSLGSIPSTRACEMTDAVRSGKPVFVESRDAFEQRYGAVEAQDRFESRSCAPLVIGDRVFGVLAVAFTRAHAMPERDRSFFVAIADQCAQAVERARLLEIERRSRLVAEAAERRRAALQTVSDSALAHVGLDALLSELVARVRRTFASDSAALLLLDESRRQFVHQAVEGFEAMPPPPPIAIERGIAGQIARGRRPVAIEDLFEVEVAWPALKEHLHSILGVPVHRGEDVIGVLHVGYAERRAFSPDDIELLQLLADRIATAVERTLAYERLRRAEERLRIALESGQMGVWEWSPVTSRIAWSAKLEQILGHTPGTFPGTVKAFVRVIHPDDRDDVLAKVRKSLAGKQDLVLQCRVVRRDGQVRWVAGRGSVFTDADGAVASLTGTCLDVTDRIEFEQLRDKAMTDLTRDMQLNEMFVGILSHDLRTPLSSITLGANLLQMHENLTATQQDAVLWIANAGERMTRLVAQLLDLTRGRLTAGIPTDRRRVDLSSVVRSTVAELELAHPDAALVVDIEPDLQGVWDPDRIAQVVSNLASNATTHGGKTAPVGIRLVGEGDQVRLSVHNRGTPIPPDALPRIFEPYVRARRGSRDGLGLGLYITAQIVQAHGGRIDVTSTETDGTTFTVTLPR